MKRIIRLTESDLTRIVKRVLKEEESKTIKVKAFSDIDDHKSGLGRSLNLDTTNHKVVGTKVEFDYVVPGNTVETVPSWAMSQFGCSVKVSKGKGHVLCGRAKDSIALQNVDHTDCKKMKGGEAYNGGLDYFFLSPEGYKKLSSKCNAYASMDKKQDDLDMGGDYA